MKFTNLAGFEKHIKDASPKHFADTYMIIGKDRFTCKMAIDRLIVSLLTGQKNPELCLKTFDGDHHSIDGLLCELQTMAFFSEKQIIWVDNADKLPKPIMKSLEGYFQHPNRSQCLIISGAAINHATNFYKLAEKNGVVLEFAEEKPAEKERLSIEWLNTTVTASGKKIDPKASQYLVKQIGTDMALLHNEVAKLLCYVGDRPAITLQDIGAICTSVNLENGWQLGEALFRRDASTALRISKALMNDGTAFLPLLRQIRHQFQTAYQVCSILASGGTSQDISQQFPYMRGFILDTHVRNAQAYGMKRFKKGMQIIDETEIAAKNSGIDNDLLAELLIIKLVT